LAQITDNLHGERQGPSEGEVQAKILAASIEGRYYGNGDNISDKWEHVWREDRGEISTREWLHAMLADDVLRDVWFTVDIPQPSAPLARRIQDIASQKLERLSTIVDLPEPSMSVCNVARSRDAVGLSRSICRARRAGLYAFPFERAGF
jgi:hypothetical protein